MITNYRLGLNSILNFAQIFCTKFRCLNKLEIWVIQSWKTSLYTTMKLFFHLFLHRNFLKTLYTYFFKICTINEFVRTPLHFASRAQCFRIKLISYSNEILSLCTSWVVFTAIFQVPQFSTQNGRLRIGINITRIIFVKDKGHEFFHRFTQNEEKKNTDVRKPSYHLRQ